MKDGEENWPVSVHAAAAEGGGGFTEAPTMQEDRVHNIQNCVTALLLDSFALLCECGFKTESDSYLMSFHFLQSV